MSTALNTQPTSDFLLANRDVLSLDHSRRYLVGRVRAQTPLGAAEFLDCLSKRQSDKYAKRLETAIDCLEIYRSAFPQEYARSSSPYFSIQREHEFYRLVHTKLFPLSPNEEIDIEQVLERDARYWLPFIPVRGIQQHLWEGGQFDFWKIELCFRIAQVLGGNTGAGGAGWRALSMVYGLDDMPAPRPPLACVGWDLFVHSCNVEDSPLRFLPLAFNLIGYQTGNVWLDLPQVGCIGYEWSMKEVAELAVMWQNAETVNVAIKSLDIWLEEDPKRGIKRAVELWNDASHKEEEWGFGGMLVPDLVEAGGIPLGNDLVMMPEEARALLQTHLRELMEETYDDGRE